MKAVVIYGPGDARVTDRPKPKLRDDYVLVKVKVVAINPTVRSSCVQARPSH
jgi:NADPH:quinone reductase-like Zn-dependent oxidoreductase